MIADQLIKKFPAPYGRKMFIAVFIGADARLKPRNEMNILKRDECTYSCNVIATVRHARLYKCAVRTTRENINKFLTVATLIERNAEWPEFLGVLESSVLFCVTTSRRNMASVAVKIFLHLIYVKKRKIV